MEKCFKAVEMNQKINRDSFGRWLLLAALLGACGVGRVHADGYTPEQYYSAGYNSYQAQQYTQAITYLNSAIQLNPAYGSAYQLAGNCYYALGDRNDALVYYMKASSLQPGNAQLAQLVLNLQAQVNTTVTAQTDSSTTVQSTVNGDDSAAAPPATDDDSESDDSTHYDQAKSRMIRISGPQHKAYLYDTTDNHTLDHVLLCDNVTDVQFLTDTEGKAWRIILTQKDGTQMTYDQDGHFMVKGHA